MFYFFRGKTWASFDPHVGPTLFVVPKKSKFGY
nr:MAG TPA: hypothetical protein [Caudoviricetes sp.]